MKIKKLYRFTKNYKKILEGVVNIISITEKSDISFANIRTYLGENCPELLESEDEKIRKELLEHCKNQAKPYIQTGNKCPQIQSWIAWLERQGEKPQGKSALEAIKEEKVDDQDCVNSADRIETTFHEGDWVVDKSGLVQQVLEFRGGIYTCTYNSFGTDCESNYHLWTIDDAKDGDVLADEDNNIGIYRGKVDDVDWHSYVYLGCDNYLYGYKIGGYHNIRNTKPATKEQHDQLEKAIADAGFTFDFEKKELNKVEQHSENTKLSKFEEAIKDMVDVYRDTIGSSDATTEEVKEHSAYLQSLISQTPAWSEEDEKRVESLHGWLDTLVNYIHHDTMVSLDLRRERMQQVERLKTWLKLLKDRYTWKPSDEQMRILSIYADQNNTHGAILTSLYNDLKKLKE
jgi:uncharacterized membrane-anchored protein YhcB (DUF1043 family)